MAEAKYLVEHLDLIFLRSAATPKYYARECSFVILRQR